MKAAPNPYGSRRHVAGAAASSAGIHNCTGYTYNEPIVVIEKARDALGAEWAGGICVAFGHSRCTRRVVAGCNVIPVDQ